MSYPRRLVQTATLTSVSMTGAPNAQGNPTPVESSATWPCLLTQPVGKRGSDTTELTGDRDAVITTFVLFLPAAVVVTPRDKATIAGDVRTFQVIGDPVVVMGRRSPHHIEVRLRVIDGG